MAILSSFINSAYSSNLFTFKDGTFIAEASDFSPHYDLLNRIYDDAIDVGISIRSERSGRTVGFYLHETRKDDEGDILHWEYRPISEHVHRFPSCVNTKIIILND